MNELKAYIVYTPREGVVEGLWKSYAIRIDGAEVYLKSDVDKVLADKDEKIRRLKRALYKACANWADIVAFEETEGIGYDNRVAERWRKMERKCLKQAEEYK